MSTISRQESVLLLKSLLEELLGKEYCNLLAIYELYSGTQKIGETQAIAVVYPGADENLTKKIRVEDGKGLEVVIASEPDMDLQSFSFSTAALREYEVILKQHCPTSGLTEAINAIYANQFLRPFRQPIIRRAEELPNNEGLSPARAILYVPQGLTWQENIV